jgi:hypothetical protein
MDNEGGVSQIAGSFLNLFLDKKIKSQPKITLTVTENGYIRTKPRSELVRGL